MILTFETFYVVHVTFQAKQFFKIWHWSLNRTNWAVNSAKYRYYQLYFYSFFVCLFLWSFSVQRACNQTVYISKSFFLPIKIHWERLNRISVGCQQNIIEKIFVENVRNKLTFLKCRHTQWKEREKKNDFIRTLKYLWHNFLFSFECLPFYILLKTFSYFNFRANE